MAADPLHSELHRWLDLARLDEAAAARIRERNLRLIESEEATLLGLLVDLGEGRRPVLLHDESGRSHRGTVVAVGADFVALRQSDGEALLLPIPSLTTLRPAPGPSPAGSPPPARTSSRPAGGGRAPPLDARLVDVLCGLASDRPRVRLLVRGEPDQLAGRLRACGADVLSLEIGEPRTLCWVPLAAVQCVALVDER